MKELLEKILGQIKKTPSGVRAYEDLYHICLETQKTDIPLSVEYLKKLSDIIENRIPQSETDKHRFSTLTCRAINASLTGATRCDKILYADDLCSGIEEAMSKERLDKLWSAYTNDLKSRKKEGAKEIHIAMTRAKYSPRSISCFNPSSKSS